MTKIISRSPIDGTVLGEAAIDDPDSVDAKIEAAAKCRR